MKKNRVTIIILLSAVLLLLGMNSAYKQTMNSLFADEKKVTAEETSVPSENENSETENSDNSEENSNATLVQPPVVDRSLFATVQQGGKLMFAILILALAALTIIIERIIYFTKNKIWTGNQLVIELRDTAENSKQEYSEDMEESLRTEFKIYANNMERGMSLLSGIGNISPIVGFLGTVIGMIDAFASIAAATTVNAKVVAVGIQVALVTTAGGLCVAAPALAFYYFFLHIVQNRYANAEEVITDICELMPKLSKQL